MPQELADVLEQVVTGGVQSLHQLYPLAMGDKPSPDTWSKKEVLGHLIDSAANNHHRFVRAQQTSELQFPPYDQNA